MRSDTASSDAERQRLADELGWLELASLPADLVAGLPLATALVVRLPRGAIATLVLSEARAGIAVHGPSLSAAECRRVARAAECGRMDADDLEHWVQQKSAEAGFEVTEEVAFGGARAQGVGHWSLGRVLTSLRAQVLDVVVADESHGSQLPLAA